MLKNPLYVYGPKNVSLPASLNFGEFLLDTVIQYGDREALINAATGDSITYKQLSQEAMNFAVSLTQLGVGKGQTVGICSENRFEFVSTAIGTITTGAVLTTVNIGYTKDELKHIMNISKPTCVVCSPLGFKTHGDVFRSLKFIKRIIVFGTETPPGVIQYKDMVSKHVAYENFVANDVQAGDVVMVLYSSGTTGLPKGVMLTHHNVLLACNMYGKDPTVEITSLSVAPWYHTMGLMGCLNSLLSSRKAVYMPRFEERLYFETIQKYRVDILVLVPPIAVLLTKSKLLDNYDVTTVKLVFCGAAPLDTETVNEVKKRFPNLVAILQGYGMTEATLAITRDLELAPKPGSVGPAMDHTIFKIVDTETGQPLGPYKSGEICIKGPMIMRGYIGKARKEDFDEEGFYKTGDIGYYDDDKYFFIVDRLKELIKYKGYQVPPAEIEALLLQHPGVRDAGVVGKPDKSAGEVPVAFVVKQPGVDVTEKDIIDFVASKLSNAKHLRGGVWFVTEIPKNPSGKILRKHLRKMLKTKSKL